MSTNPVARPHLVPPAAQERPRTDAELAQAYRDLEGQIADLRHACTVLDLMFESVMEYGPAKRPPEWLRLGHLAEAGHLAFVLAPDQFEGLHYSVTHAIDLARGLDRHYQAGFNPA